MIASSRAAEFEAAEHRNLGRRRYRSLLDHRPQWCTPRTAGGAGTNEEKE